MLEELGKLAEQGRLRNFTDLADAVARVDQTIGHVDDKQALYRVARLLDSVFGQAYRGEKSMAFLAERVNSVAEVLDLMAMEETDTPDATEATEDPAAEPADPKPSQGEGQPKADGEANAPQADTSSSVKWGVMWSGPNGPTT